MVRPDQVSLGVLVSAVPRGLVDEAVAVCGVRERRSDGKLPAHVITYLTLALCLFPDDDYTEVATKVTGSLDRWNCWNAAWSVPTTSAITQARKRLGRHVFAELFERCCGPVAGKPGPTAEVTALGTARGSFLRRWRLLGIDGFEVDLPDSKENAAEFGYAGSGDNRSAFPKARVVALAECGTHAFVAAEVDAYAVGEKTLAQRLYPLLRADELLTADRGFYSWQGWDTAAATGAALLWRVKADLRLPVLKLLPDGSYLSLVARPTLHDKARDKLIAAARAGECPGPAQAMRVRVIEYEIAGRDGDGSGELIALITTITDPAAASAQELAEAYCQRWEEETGNDQLKTCLRGPGAVLRSKSPAMVRQEIYGYLLTHYAISALICQAATEADIDPDRVKFLRTVRIIRRRAADPSFPP